MIRRTLQTICLASSLLIYTGCTSEPPALEECSPGDKLCPGESNRYVDAFPLGTDRQETLQQLGGTLVHNCIDPLFPFPNPMTSHQFKTEDGKLAVIDVYVSRINNLQVCETVKFDTVPLVFIDGKLVSKEWRYVHKHRQYLDVSSGWIKKQRTYNKHLTKKIEAAS